MISGCGCLQRAHVGMGAANPIEPTIEIERALGCPGALHQVQIFLCPLIALGLRREVAVAFLLGIGLASDDVERDAAAGQLVEGRDLAGEQGGCDEARPMRDRYDIRSVRAAACIATRKPSADDEE